MNEITQSDGKDIIINKLASQLEIVADHLRHHAVGGDSAPTHDFLMRLADYTDLARKESMLTDPVIEFDVLNRIVASVTPLMNYYYNTGKIDEFLIDMTRTALERLTYMRQQNYEGLSWRKE